MPPVIIVASHRRSGTHWTIDSLRHNSLDIKEKYINLDRLLPRHHRTVTSQQFSDFARGNILIKTHSPHSLSPFLSGGVYEYVNEVLASSKVIYVVRDGRDVMVSLYYYLQHIGRDPGTFSEFLKQDNEFDVDRINRIDYWVQHVAGWMDNADVVIQYEALHSKYEEAVKTMIGVLGFRPKEDIVSISLGDDHSSAVVPRRGTIGDWKNHFSLEDLDYFNEKAGGIMAKLEYE